MPPPVSVSVPVTTSSELDGKLEHGMDEFPKNSPHKRRAYDNEPLPTRPSDFAPCEARVVGRILDGKGATYQLKIGNVDINDVGVEEILDYVSPLDLEEFEHRQFEEERDVLNVIEESKEQHRREKFEQRKEIAKRKGIVFYEDVDAEDVVESTDGGEATFSARGRARPTYTHLFQQFKQRRRRRKRDPITQELLPLSDNEDDLAALDSSQDEISARVSSTGFMAQATELPKRRRRKRDKVTGELLPLPPLLEPPIPEKKKRRRTRDAMTNELMPVNWRYDQSENEDSSDSARDPGSTSFTRLSISQEHQTKRQRRSISSSGSQSSSPEIEPRSEVPRELPASGPHTGQAGSAFETVKAVVIDLTNCGDESEAGPSAGAGSSSLKIKEQQTASPNLLSKNITMLSKATPSASVSLNEPEMIKTSITRPSASQNWRRPHPDNTSAFSPAANRTPSLKANDTSDSESEQEEGTVGGVYDHQLSDPKSHSPGLGEDDELGDSEYEVEAILAHQLSDPRTHRTDFGKEPIMLYKVKWKGYEEPTWEPATCFKSLDIIREYYGKGAEQPNRFGNDEQRGIASDYAAGGGLDSV